MSAPGRQTRPNTAESQQQVSGHRSDVARKALTGRTLTRGVSIEYGTGEKEMKLMRGSMIETFDLLELSAQRLLQGNDLAARTGVSERGVFRVDDPFTA